MSSTDSPPARGLFIVFEGGDGSGKSTQADLLAERIGAVLTREPGGTPIGQQIRELVLDPTKPELSARTEALLMAASRAQHVTELIRPALDAGHHVVCDRYVASSLAYQGAGRGLGIDTIRDLNDFAIDGIHPDLTVLLDADPDAARGRLGDELDRIEHAGRALGEVVTETYRELAQQHPHTWVVIDANGSIDEVGARVAEVVLPRLGLA